MAAKVGGNDPCPCGSGRKYKKCHGSLAAEEEANRAKYGAFGGAPDREGAGTAPSKNLAAVMSKMERERRSGTRPRPSGSMISIGDSPPPVDRRFLVDTCAELVDQTFGGRSEMCIYFAVLLRHGLRLLGYDAEVEVGKGQYRSVGSKDFTWDHAWVRMGNGEVIDGNVDSLVENPMVPVGVEPKPYWGPADELPDDRKLFKNRVLPPERDLIELDEEPTKHWKRVLEEKIRARPSAV